MNMPLQTPPPADLYVGPTPKQARSLDLQHHLRALLTIIGDVLAILAGLATTHLLIEQVHPGGGFNVSGRMFQADWALSLAVLLCAFCFRLNYKSHYTEHPAPWDQLRDICYTTTAIMITHGFFFFLMKEDFSRSMIVLGWILSIPFILTFRVGIRKLCEKRDIWKINALLVLKESVPATNAYVSHLESTMPGYQWKVARRGAVTPEDIQSVNMVFFLSDRIGDLQSDFSTQLDLCSYLGKKIGCITSDQSVSQFNAEIRTTYFDSPTLFQIKSNLTVPWKRACKRTIDILLSSIGLLCASPIILLFSILVRLDGGPSLYAHQRVGKKGVAFNCHKIRSMYVNSDSLLKEHLERDAEARIEWKAYQKLSKDPRVTPLGRFMRKTCIDELPQLYDVLIGNMSLVGPRPVTAGEMDRYVQSKMRYISVRPGITGIWQCSPGDRNACDYRRRVGMDTWYINNWSIWLDIMILLKTIPTVLTGREAH